jgi:hypothetical protein
MVFYASLSPSRSHKSRSVEFYAPTITDASPCDGLLVIRKAGKEPSLYAVSEGLVGLGYGLGRCFRLDKAGTEPASYWCFLASDRRQSTCDCPGFAYESSRRADRRHNTSSPSLGCCHLDGLAAILAAGHLPDPRCNGEQDTGATEVSDQPDPADLQGGW